MEKKEIVVGDIVRVNFNNLQFTFIDRGEVRNIPSAIGESWIIYDIDDGRVHYISEGCTITKLENNNEKE